MALLFIVFLSVTTAILNHIIVVDAGIDSYVGVCYVGHGTDIPSPPDVVALCHKNFIPKVRLLEYDDTVMQTLRGVEIVVAIGIKNDDLRSLSIGATAAVKQWFETNVEPFLDEIVFNYIIVGNHVIPGPLEDHVLHIMMELKSLLEEKNLSAIEVTTAVSPSVLASVIPPSNATFTPETSSHMSGVLLELQRWGSPLMINIYPYDYVASGQVQQDFATFTAGNQSVIWDGQLRYWNMFDVLVDAFFWAMEKEGKTGVRLVVGETGWPSAGNGKLKTPEIARTYNQNFMDHITSIVGTPKRPGVLFEGFIYALFDDQEHFGIFGADKRPLYQLHFPNGTMRAKPAKIGFH